MLPEKMNQWLEEVCLQLRRREAVSAVREELSVHLCEQYEAYRNDGLSEKQASEQCVADMGDAAEVGTKLDQVHRPRPAWGVLIILSVVLLSGSVLQQFLTVSASWEAITFDLLWVGVAWGVAATLVLWCVYFFADYAILARFWQICYCVYCAGLLLFFMQASQINGARRFLYGVYYDALVLLFLPIYAAALCHYKDKGYLGMIKTWVLAAPILLFCLEIPSISNTLLLAVSLFGIHFICGVKNWFGISKQKNIFILLLCTGSAVALLHVMIPNALYRFMQQINFTLDPEGAGWQGMIYHKMRTGMHWIGQGNAVEEIFFTGMARSNELVYIGWRWGAVFAVIMVAAVCVALICLWNLVRRTKNMTGHMMGITCMVWFTIKTGVSLLYAVGLYPSEMMLPFISGSHSMFFAQTILAGLLLSAFRIDTVRSIKMIQTQKLREIF